MSLKIRPIGDKLLLCVVEEGEFVEKGVVTSRDPSRANCREAIVRAVGNEYRGDLVPGDTVFLKPWCSGETRINRELLVFTRESELIASQE